MVKKSIITIIIFLLLILVYSLIVLNTYFNYKDNILNKASNAGIMNTIESYDDIKIDFSDTSNVSLINTNKGEEIIKKFKVINISDYSTYYDLLFSNVINNYSKNNYLVYELTSTNKGGIRTKSIMPRKDEYIVKNIYIPASSRQEYIMKITFLNKNENQSIDYNKTFSSNIKLIKSDIDDKIYKKNTLLEHIIKDINIKYTNTSTFGNTIYYYSGVNQKNNVVFNNKCFQIIRTDDDNNIKMIYYGIYEDGICKPNIINKTKFNSKSTYNAYVGYMYGKPNSNNYNIEHNNINSSNIKSELESWFNLNFKENKEYISTSAIYCNDRYINSFITSDESDKIILGGYGNLKTDYSDKNGFICYNINDRFSVSRDETNNSLNSSIGLLELSEYLMSLDQNNKTYLETNYDYWTMTPSKYDGSNAYNYVISNDKVVSKKVDSEYVIRPVITLKNDVKYSSGDGSIDSPLIILRGN